jgi:CHAT domain-containing protein
MLGLAEPLYERLTTLLLENEEYGAALELHDRPRSVGFWCCEPGKPTNGNVQRLPEDGLTIAYGLVGDLVYAWVIGEGTARGRLLESEPGQLLALGQQLATTSRGGSPEQLDRALSHLYQELMAPLESAWKQSRRLRIIPYGPLVNVPFSALRDGSGRYLFERIEVTLLPALPSGSAVASDRVPLEGLSVLAVGDPEFSRRRFPDLGWLPGARREAEGIYELYGGRSTLLVGSAATASKVLDRMPEHPVSHLAVHVGRDPENPLGLQVILGRDSTADGNARHGIDGRDVIYLDLSDTVMVVLSACGGSAQGSTGNPGSDPGVVPSLLAAGAESVVASAAPTEDATASDFMYALHESLRSGLRPAAALRAAKIELWSRADRAVERRRSWLLFEVFTSE